MRGCVGTLHTSHCVERLRVPSISEVLKDGLQGSVMNPLVAKIRRSIRIRARSSPTPQKKKPKESF